MDKHQGSQFLKAVEEDESYYDRDYSASNQGCFARLFCFRWWRNDETGGHHHLLQQGAEHKKEPWWEEKLKKAKEASEVFAGPKWKNFIRKVGGYFGKGRGHKNTFQYDSQSYALNFDQGFGQQQDDQLYNGFSARFAPPSRCDQRPSGL